MIGPYKLNRVHCGEAVEMLRKLPDECIDAVVTDPPYGIRFMGMAWDSFEALNARAEQRKSSIQSMDKNGKPRKVPRKSLAEQAGSYDFSKKGNVNFQHWTEQWAREAFRILKPGGHLLCFAGTRTYHRMACGVEDAGFEIRDQIGWLFGSGFPKSLDVSKAIDKAAGAERKVIGLRTGTGSKKMCGDVTGKGFGKIIKDTAPATDAVRQWQGWGTALKPSWEPVVVARKPLTGTVAENVLQHGTGALNIDGCRVFGNMGPDRSFGKPRRTDNTKYSKANAHMNPQSPFGRWPANVVHDGSDEVMQAFPDAPGQQGKVGPENGGKVSVNCYGDYHHHSEMTPRLDGGSAARFFYCAKASAEERVSAKVFNGGEICSAEENMVLVELLKRATSELTVKWSIEEFGKNIMAVCQLDTFYTTLTEIKKITESKISKLLTPSLIRDCIAVVNSLAENGGNRAGNAENLKKYLTDITSEKQAELVHGVKNAAFQILSKIKEKENWSTLSHPTVKPVDLMRWLVRLVTPPGGIVIDPFSGSGSTGVAAIQQGFRFLGFDMDPRYCHEITSPRLAAAERGQTVEQYKAGQMTIFDTEA